jgi:hypothetical protein
METLGNKSQAITGYKYYCENCNYGTSKKSGIDSHLLTAKHKKQTNGNVLETLGNETQADSDFFKYECINCSKKFKNRSGLWKHKQKCNIDNQPTPSSEVSPELIKLITELVKGQHGLQESIIELCKNGTHNTTHTNSHNKSFNLQFFLNETCKNAMNITDFVDSLQLQLSDLEKVGEIGYVEGISNIIIKNLNALDITLRPVHCTDKKRETMYIKDENKWEKEDDNKTKLHKMVRKVSNKNIDLISDFKDLHPDWKKSTSRVSEQFDKIIIESMGGIGDNDYEKEERIIKKVSKAVFVDKNL